MTVLLFLLGAGPIAFLASEKPCPLRLERLLSWHEPSAGSGLTQDLGSSSTVPHGCAEIGVRARDTPRAWPGAFFRPYGLGREGDNDVKVCSYKTPQRAQGQQKPLLFTHSSVPQDPPEWPCREPPAQSSLTPRPALLWSGTRMWSQSKAPPPWQNLHG